MRTRHWHGATDIGQREDNEDAYEVRHGSSTEAAGDHPVAVVCDGLGGHRAGRIAAETACGAFMARYSARRKGETIAERMRDAVEAANDAIRERSEGDPEVSGMGATLAAAAVTDEGVHWISVGDSPIYVWRTKTRTVDAINPRHNEPWSEHALTSALLGLPIPLVAESTEPAAAAPGDAVIVASDGLDTLTEDEIADIAARASGKRHRTLARDLVAAAAGRRLERQDNVTAVTIGIEDPRAEPDPGKVTGRRIGDDVEVTVDGRPLDWVSSLAIRNHSPTGPEWGYSGSGPAQLALGILLALVGREQAEALYQPFKDHFLAGIRTDTWEIPVTEILDWAERTEAENRAAKA